MITVACVNWRDYLGRGSEYVAKLERAVARNLTVPHEFRCLTEDDLGTDLQGWWIKLKLFEPGRFTGDVLYLDLDVVVTGSLDGLVGLLEQDRSKLWMRDDFSYSLRKPKAGIGDDTRRQLGGVGCCNSSVMLWHGDACRRVWDTFNPAVTEELHGDQNHISRVLWPDKIAFIPDEWASSYKYTQIGQCREGVVRVFHGHPKPHHVTDAWVAECWR